MLIKEMNTVTVFAPATTSNLAIGFDMMGFPIGALGDKVTLKLRDDNQVIIQAIHAKQSLPTNIDENTATIALQAMMNDLSLHVGFDVIIHKAIPLCSGLGGSAASAVAAVVALNAFLKSPQTKEQLLEHALQAESFVSGGRHLDNLVPCLWGEFSLIRDSHTLDVISLPPMDLYCVLIHPNCLIPTKLAREALKDSIALKKHVLQSANLAGFMVALYQKDWALLQRTMVDTVIEPQRAHLLPGFYELQKNALQQGALACSFSGAGPTLFALCEDKLIAEKVGGALQGRFKKQGLSSQVWIEKITRSAPRIIESHA